MDGSIPSWNDNVDFISSVESSSSSDSEMDIANLFPGKPATENVIDPPTNKGIDLTAKDITSEGALIKRAEMYQQYMKRVPIPANRGSVVPFTSWMGLGRSLKQLYGQPLHYLTNAQLKQWDRLRIATDDDDKLLDTIIHPAKAEATVWLIEEVHRQTTSHHVVAKLWLSDPMHHAFVDSIFPQLR